MCMRYGENRTKNIDGEVVLLVKGLTCNDHLINVNETTKQGVHMTQL